MTRIGLNPANLGKPLNRTELVEVHHRYSSFGYIMRSDAGAYGWRGDNDPAP